MSLTGWRARVLPWGLAVLGVLLLGNRGFRRLLSNQWELRKSRRELAALQAEEGRLKDDLRRLKRGGSALEGAVRKELGYLRQGEVEYRFPPPPKDAP